MDAWFHTDMVLIILAGAVATFLTRIGGYVLITQMKSIPPRLEAALNAVPAAVLTTLVAPAFFTGGPDVQVAMAAALIASLRFSILPMLAVGWCAVMLMRYALGG
ncbi:MAG TPA: AzlD family protein [Mycoplana sp.]|jgi:uncharacterized membrane protein|nr:AzlD family protein [Mycoplana sp.]